MKLLLVIPPMVQLNTPYPATVFLTGFLRRAGYDVAQADPALLWVLRLLSPAGLARVHQALAAAPAPVRAKPSVAHFLRHADTIAVHAGPALQLLQGRDLSLVHRIAARRMLVEGPRFASIGPEGHEQEYLDWAFGSMGVTDKARYVATLFVEDLADALREGLDPHFDFARYGEALAASQPTIDPLLEELAHDERLTVRVLDELTTELYERERPSVVGMTIPFPGNVLGALRMAKTLRRIAPRVKIVWGGGYVNTELRELSEPRLFDYVDAVTYDDGERPLLNLLEHFAGTRPREGLLRTRLREAGEVVFVSDARESDVPMKDTGTPTYAGLPLGDYLSLVDMLNPMHRLWSDTRWNKIAVAHGCYWRKCTFCDITLHYIQHYDPLAAATLVDRIEAMIAETGGRGFHLVDEAAPPRGLAAMAEELLRRDVPIAWWGNIRFDKTFTPELCELLARSGCIAVSGGLEVAGDRLLGLMQKGVTVEQVARVTKSFSDAGVRVHAYLMYGFPTQTEQETVDALEYVRQLFAAGCLDSAYWHRLSATVHAPIGQDPRRFGIRVLPQPPATFARNDLPFADPTACDHEAMGRALRKAVYNYMHGMGLDEDVRGWFDVKVPRTTVPADYVARALAGRAPAPVAKRSGAGKAKAAKQRQRR